MAKEGVFVQPRTFFIDTNPVIPSIPKIPDKSQINIRYGLIAPYANAYIHWDPEISEVVYEVEEPLLTKDEESQRKLIKEAMLGVVNLNAALQKDINSLIEYIDKTFRLLLEELNIHVNEESYNKILYYLYRDFVGFDRIDPLLKDYFIEDIECNGIGVPIYVVHRIFRNLKTNVIFQDIDEAADFVEKLAQRCGKHISYASPILDGSLPDGSRVNATYTKDITSRGPTFTIRKFTKVPFTPIKLIDLNTVSPEILAYLWLLIQYKMNVLVTGGTGSGKTTLLNAAAFFIPPEARVVSIEDSVTGDSKIIIKEKSGKIKQTTIKNFVDNKIDAEVMTLDEHGKIIFVRPSQHIKHNVKKDIYEVITATGRKVKVTQDHSLFTLGKDGSLDEIKPTSLVAGESFLAVPRTLPIDGNFIREVNLIDHIRIFESDFLVGEPVMKIFKQYSWEDLGIAKERYLWWKNHKLIKIKNLMNLQVHFSRDELEHLSIKAENTTNIPVIFPITREFVEFCGLWLGDGSYDYKNKNVVILSNQDSECINILHKVREALHLENSVTSDVGGSLRIHSTLLYKLMRHVLGFDGYSHTKKIPEFILNLSKEQIQHFIRGYFSADGCVKKYEVTCASQSYELLEGLQTLFLRLGIISRINDFERKDKCINLSISGFEHINKFKDIGFLQQRKNDKLLAMKKEAYHAKTDIIPLSSMKVIEFEKLAGIKLQYEYIQGMKHLGRDYMQQLAPCGSEFNDLSHNDILWDKVKSVKKVSSEEIEVFDLSIPKYEKFLCNNIIVHNTRELELSRENWLPSVARTAIGAGGVGEVDLFSLLRSSFRQNPDYVIVGEVRGKEAYVLFQGMASGHASISTIHGDSVDTIIKRLETPPIELSPTLLNVLDCVCVMTHAIVKKQETRKLQSIVEIVNVSPEGIALTNTIMAWNPREDRFYFKKDSKVFEKIALRFGLTKEELYEEFRRRALILYQMFLRKINGFEDVQKIVNEYYKNPQSVLQRFGVS